MRNNPILATPPHAKAIFQLVQRTIVQTYPNYYPTGVVEFFQQLHCLETIQQDIRQKMVYLLQQSDVIVGTATVKQNHISRLFILPEYQSKGYGNQLMDFLEQKIGSDFDSIQIESSLPAENFYFNRGYQTISYHKISSKYGHFLCYQTMIKNETHNNTVGKSKPHHIG